VPQAIHAAEPLSPDGSIESNQIEAAAAPSLIHSLHVSSWAAIWLALAAACRIGTGGMISLDN
jgi:hypothetical protein